MSQHQFTTTRNERVEAAVAAVRKGRGVLVVDDEDRENEGDIIFSAASITHEQMALLIRECSGHRLPLPAGRQGPPARPASNGRKQHMQEPHGLHHFH